MTIITKSSTKKEDTGVLPLFHPQAQTHPANNHHADGIPIIVAERRVNYPCRAVFILILVALTVLTLGIIGSSILARFYGNQHTERLRFQCRLPYHSEDLHRQALVDFSDSAADASDEDSMEVRLAKPFDWVREMYKNWATALDDLESSAEKDHDDDDDDDNDDDNDDNARAMMDQFFTEKIDLDMGAHADDEGVTKIDVPDFKDGRTGRFLHDFLYNQTGIIDRESKRCFLMPLDREKVMPPTSFREMMMNMYQGKYDVDMAVVQENMRVVIPAVKDFADISPRIMAECKPATMRLYRLEKFVHGVVRRAAELGNEAKFGVFAGRMLQYDLHNMNEVARYEQAEAEAAAGQA